MKWVCLLMKGLGREKRWEMNTDVYWITALDGFCNAVPIKDMFSSIGNHSAILLRSPESRTGNTHHFFSYFVILYQDSMRFIVSCTMLVEKVMAPHSNTLAWKIPWTEGPGRLQSMGSLRVEHDWATSLSLFTFMHWRRKWQPTPVFLPAESQGRGSLVGCRLWGRTESDMLKWFSSSSSTMSECFYLLPDWLLIFHSPLSLSSRGSLVLLHSLP